MRNVPYYTNALSADSILSQFQPIFRNFKHFVSLFLRDFSLDTFFALAILSLMHFASQAFCPNLKHFVVFLSFLFARYCVVLFCVGCSLISQNHLNYLKNLENILTVSGKTSVCGLRKFYFVSYRYVVNVQLGAEKVRLMTRWPERNKKMERKFVIKNYTGTS